MKNTKVRNIFTTNSFMSCLTLKYTTNISQNKVSILVSTQLDMECNKNHKIWESLENKHHEQKLLARN